VGMRATFGCGAGRLARASALLGAALLAIAPLGCDDAMFGGRPKAPIRLGTRKLVILPFATRNRKHYESDVGRLFSKVAAQLVRDGCPAGKVADATDLPETVEGQKLEELSLAEAGRALGADYVVIGEIQDLRAKKPGSFRVLHGMMVMSARICDVKTGAVVWQVTQRKFHYPHLVGGEEVPAPTEDEQEVIQRVMIEAAWSIAAQFRGPRTPEEIRLAD